MFFKHAAASSRGKTAETLLNDSTVRNGVREVSRRRFFMQPDRPKRSGKIHFYTILALAAGLLIMLTGCNAISPSSSSANSGASKDGMPFNVAVFYYDYSDNYISSVRTSLTRGLVTAGIPYREYDAASSQSTQNAQIDSALNENVSLLIVNIVNSGSSNATDAICMKAYRADIPVIFFNRPVEDNGDEGVILNFYDNVAFVGTDPAEAGHLQGQLIGEYLLENFKKTDLNGDGKISYAMFKGEAKNAEAIYRTKYAVEDANAYLTKAGYPELYYFNQNAVDNYQLDLTGKWSLTAVQDYMLTNLAQYNEEMGNMIELVICNSDTMAEGAIRALQTYGYNLGTDDSTNIPVFGVDASIPGRQLIAENKMTGTVVQDAGAMAECILHLSKNVAEEKDMLYGTEKYSWDEEHDLHNKFYMHYSLYDPSADPLTSAVADSETDR